MKFKKSICIKRNFIGRIFEKIFISTLFLLPLICVVSCGAVDDETKSIEPTTIPSVSQMGETPHFEIYWSTVENASGYRLKRMTPDGHEVRIDVGNVIHYQDTGFVPQKLYDESVTWVVKYDVCALDENNNEGPWAGESQGMMYPKPRQPFPITVDSLLSEIKVSWRSDLDVSEEYNYFNVYRSVQQGEYPQTPTLMASTDSLFAIDPYAFYGLSNFSYIVTTVKYGIESRDKDYASLTLGAPPAVKNVAFSYDTSAYTVTLTWTNPDIREKNSMPFLSDSLRSGTYDSLTSYQISEQTDSSMTLGWIQQGIPYYVYLASCIEGLCSHSDTIQVYCGELTDTIPGAVTNIEASGYSPWTMKIQWGLVYGATEYRVFRKDSLFGTYQPLTDWFKAEYPFRYNNIHFSDISIGKYAFFDDAADQGNLYFYKVLARNSFGEGVEFTGTWATTDWQAANPPEPPELPEINSTDSVVMLNWSAQGNNTTGFTILRNDTADLRTAEIIADSLMSLTFSDTTPLLGDSAYYWIGAQGISDTTYSAEPVAVFVRDTGSSIITDPSDSTAHLALMVIDSCSGEALEGTSATLYGTSITASADSSGNIVLGHISVPKPDTTRLCSVTVSKPGYMTKEHSVEIEIGEYTFSPLELTPQEGCMADTVLELTLANSSQLDLDIHSLVPDTSGGDPTDVGTMTGNLFSDPFAKKFSVGDESIVFSQLYDDIYTVYVRAWSDPSKPTIPESGASIVITKPDGFEQTIQASAATGSGDYWNVCTINGGTGEVTVVNSLSDQSP